MPARTAAVLHEHAAEDVARDGSSVCGCVVLQLACFWGQSRLHLSSVGPMHGAQRLNAAPHQRDVRRREVHVKVLHVSITCT